MIDAMVNIAGSIFIAGIGLVAFAFGVMILTVFITEIYNQFWRKR